MFGYQSHGGQGPRGTVDAHSNNSDADDHDMHKPKRRREHTNHDIQEAVAALDVSLETCLHLSTRYLTCGDFSLIPVGH